MKLLLLPSTIITFNVSLTTIIALVVQHKIPSHCIIKSLQVGVHAVTFTLEVEVVGGSWSKEADAGRGSGCICDKRIGVAIEI